MTRSLDDATHDIPSLHVTAGWSRRDWLARSGMAAASLATGAFSLAGAATAPVHSAWPGPPPHRRSPGLAAS